MKSYKPRKLKASNYALYKVVKQKNGKRYKRKLKASDYGVYPIARRAKKRMKR